MWGTRWGGLLYSAAVRPRVGLPFVRLSSGYETRSCSRFHRSKSFMPPEMAVRMIQCRMHAPMAKMRIPPMKGIAVIRSLLGGLGRLAHLAGSRTIMGWPQRPYHLSRTGSGDFHHSLLLLAEACCGQSAAGTGAGAARAALVGSSRCKVQVIRTAGWKRRMSWPDGGVTSANAAAG